MFEFDRNFSIPASDECDSNEEDNYSDISVRNILFFRLRCICGQPHNPVIVVVFICHSDKAVIFCCLAADNYAFVVLSV